MIKPIESTTTCCIERDDLNVSVQDEERPTSIRAFKVELAAGGLCTRFYGWNSSGRRLCLARSKGFDFSPNAS
jgi:hypothetical protein